MSPPMPFLHPACSHADDVASVVDVGDSGVDHFDDDYEFVHRRLVSRSSTFLLKVRRRRRRYSRG